jgi:hypothetical protein
MSKAEYMILCAMRLGLITPSLIEIMSEKFQSIDSEGIGSVAYEKLLTPVGSCDEFTTISLGNTDDGESFSPTRSYHYPTSTTSIRSLQNPRNLRNQQQSRNSGDRRVNSYGSVVRNDDFDSLEEQFQDGYGYRDLAVDENNGAPVDSRERIDYDGINARNPPRSLYSVLSGSGKGAGGSDASKATNNLSASDSPSRWPESAHTLRGLTDSSIHPSSRSSSQYLELMRRNTFSASPITPKPQHSAVTRTASLPKSTTPPKAQAGSPNIGVHTSKPDNRKPRTSTAENSQATPPGSPATNTTAPLLDYISDLVSNLANTYANTFIISNEGDMFGGEASDVGRGYASLGTGDDGGDIDVGIGDIG